MSILGNNLLAQYYAQNQGLPFGYEAVEYLESTGTQWIDTNIIPCMGDDFDICFSTNASGNNTLISAGTGDFQLAIVLLSPTCYFRYFTSSGNGVSMNHLAWDRIRIINNGLCYYNSLSIYSTPQGELSTPSNLILLIRNNYTNQFRGKIKNYKHIRENAIIRNFIPCVRKSDNKPGLYDLCRSICPLTGTPFYINAGTGEFVTP